MPDSDSITAILSVQSETSDRALQQTLETLSWVNEILIADAVGLNLSALKQQTALVHLPLIGFSERLLRYRAALSASSKTLLFVSPGELIQPELLAEIQTIARDTNRASRSYAFPRRITWHEITWFEPASCFDPDLIERDHCIEELCGNRNSEIQPLSNAITRCLDSGSLLTWLQQAGEQQARIRLATEGTARLQAALASSWLKEIFGKGIREGILKGGFFKGWAQRVALFIQLVQIHIGWFKLYEYLQPFEPPIHPQNS